MKRHDAVAVAIGLALVVFGLGGALVGRTETAIVALFGVVVGGGWLLVILALFVGDLEQLDFTALTNRVNLKTRRRELTLDAAAETASGSIADALAEPSEDGTDAPRTDAYETSVLRVLAADRALPALLTPDPDGPLHDADLQVFIYDEEVDRLLPISEPHTPENTESHGWRPGQGATGWAYTEGSFVVVTGGDVVAGYGLTHAQRERYEGITAIASTPVFNSSGEVIAVLSASSRNRRTKLDTADAKQDLLVSALLVGRILVDLLQWFDD